MDNLRRDTAELTVVAVVEDLIQDWGLDQAGSVNGATTLVKDLQFASVDIIQLCVALEQSFERKLGFQNLLMRDGSYVGDLSVEQIARFIELRLETPQGNGT